MDFPEVELHQDGVRLTSLVLGMNLFLRPPLKACAGPLLNAYGEWLDIAGRERLLWYATETMSKHRKVTAKTLAMLPAWLAPDAPRREFVAIKMKDGDRYEDTGRVVFEVLSEDDYQDDPEDEELAYLHFALPAGEARGRLDELRAFFVRACSRLPVRYGAAGYGIETSPYRRGDAQTHAWAKAMRHVGLDLYSGHLDRRAAGIGAVKTVSWLTMIDAGLAEEVGGRAAIRAALPPEVEVGDLPNGLILAAGEAPGVGDVNRRDRLPLYAAVDRALKPLVERALEQSLSFLVDDDEDGEATPRWFRRFERWS